MSEPPLSLKDAFAVPVDDPALQRDLIAGLASQSLRAMVSVLVVGTAFLLVFLDFTPRIAVLWYCGFLVVQGINLAGWFAYRNSTSDAMRDPDQQARRIMRVAFLNGASLGATGWLFFGPEFGAWWTFTIIILCGCAAAAIHFYAYYYRAMLAFLVPLATPLELRLWSEGPPEGWLAGSMYLLFMATVVLFGRNQARLVLDSYRMRYENLQLIEMLKAKTQTLEQLGQAKSRFFAAASHDLRQPVQAMGYYLSLFKPDPSGQGHVDRLAQCLDSMEKLLEALLDIARLDAGRVQSQRRATNLHALLQHQASLYEGVALAKNLQFRIRLPRHTIASADTDPELLERIIANLINNAIRYTEHGGVLLSVRKKAGHWAVAVSDTGCGIDPAALHDIFNEFTQLGNVERNRNQGSGLGLSIVQRICRLLEIPLNVCSVVGKGTRFECLLPMTDADAMPPSMTDGDVDLQLHGRIMLVEDDPLVLESLAKVLAGWGLETHCASDGDQALALARHYDFVAVISDWRLPGTLDGSALLTSLPALQPKLKLRILLTGEHHLPEQMPGSDILVLQKPAKPIRLRALLTAHLS
ncbi:MAG: ATP-binding protein [Pseudomonadota bacterium]